MKKGFPWAFIILALLVVAVIFISIKPSQERGPAAPDSENKISKTEQVTKQDAKATLASFPEGFPAESGIEASSGYKYIPANSQSEQSTLEYTSKKSLAENKKIFTDFLAKSGYTVANKVEQAGLVFLYATLDQTDLSIKIEEKSGQVSVSATHLKK